LKAIVGLGNPGGEYDGTRHNLGFEVVDELARRWNVKLKSWKSVTALAVSQTHGALLAKPKTYMNLSGEAVQRIAAFHQIEPSDILIVVDDVNLPLGRLRLRRSGSAGGHNGLKSVIQHVGQDFARLRIGVGRGDAQRDLSSHVLGKIAGDESSTIVEATVRAADAVEEFVANGIETAMNRFNPAGETVSEEERKAEM
jgi:peptidyl-tRNA hydrolase, PTH1 family